MWPCVLILNGARRTYRNSTVPVHGLNPNLLSGFVGPWFEASGSPDWPQLLEYYNHAAGRTGPRATPLVNTRGARPTRSDGSNSINWNQLRGRGELGPGI
ncbi:hypothetical protein J6590_012999 [Homalodisca vitripennis]|nr:hypothetical protein J6590_012999 [Homalodisca vitripennis]